MPAPIIDAVSVLTLDIGSIHTRAALYDVVDGQYRLVAASKAPSTFLAPFQDAGMGAAEALARLQEVSGRAFLDENNKVSVPRPSGAGGADKMALTYSAGTELRIATIGLMPDLSVESCHNLAAMAGGKIVESLAVNDPRSIETQLDALLNARPDLIILAGGTNRGARQGVIKLADLLVLLCQVTPLPQRPGILYCGNEENGKQVKEMLEKWTAVEVAPNIRPTVDQEDLQPAVQTVCQITNQLRFGQVGGLQKLAASSSVPPLTTAYAMGRMIRFLSTIYSSGKGVLGVDLGSRYTIIASGFQGQLAQKVFPWGCGEGTEEALADIPLEDLEAWLSSEISSDEVRDYLHQKAIQPASLPLSKETLDIEQALCRMILRMGLRHIRSNWPGNLAAFEPILASGGGISMAPTPGQSLLMLLDGIQPIGVTTMILDTNNLLPGLGAAAEINPLLPVQAIDSNAFVNLGTVISPLSSAKPGTAILRVRLDFGEGNELRRDIQQGSLVSMPLKIGQSAAIHLEPFHRTQIDPKLRPGPASFRISGGACGLVIDARGRPLRLPSDIFQRREIINNWREELGG